MNEQPHQSGVKTEQHTSATKFAIYNLRNANDIENKSGGSGHRSWYLSHTN